MPRKASKQKTPAAIVAEAHELARATFYAQLSAARWVPLGCFKARYDGLKMLFRSFSAHVPQTFAFGVILSSYYRESERRRSAACIRTA